MTPAVVRQHIFHCTSFQFGKYPDETFAMFKENGSHVFRKKEIQMGMQKMKFQ
jgi:hypothetical protein